MGFLSTVFYIFLLIIMGIFAFLNPTKVAIDYHWGTINWPVGIVIIIGFILGWFIGTIIGSLKGRGAMKKKMMNKFSKISVSQAQDAKNSLNP